ncbi:dihydrofolate reductase [Bacillus atrophaeus]|uniref:dihydrofolate reductase n=1 Tax=Bacillus atrophaeus TaxID=1452 RepID=UPI0022812C02|nr:dihydrofolate reductase [Bacillus atrophaeus]MCY7948023.1 dihydrofolate reductase [Bacillus atrophaeus]MCY8098032.1 dihydrofolate reductase [Bacillus atrophaeus]MCY9169956.1 dihydrofolate reductase [Bacillus atrophaeus]MEC0740681.1 dihydrofolate reductase [Bacillus atrophaeus]MEC0747055.1 dihydrofolate reductase [Bacillus atrophaeus]
MITLIACVDEYNAIGRTNGLLAHLPKDLKHFKNITLGKVCVFGRKTYESLPIKPLPLRKNVILTKDKKANFEGCSTANSIKQFMKAYSDQDIFVCGGEKVYKQFMPLADELIITRIEYEFKDADAFFPEIDDSWIPYFYEREEDLFPIEIMRYKRRSNTSKKGVLKS